MTALGIVLVVAVTAAFMIASFGTPLILPDAITPHPLRAIKQNPWAEKAA